MGSWNFDAMPAKSTSNRWDGDWQNYRPPAPRPDAERLEARPPSGATTLLVTVFFGVFGLIPMLMHSAEARRIGRGDETSRYVGAFVFGLVINIIGILVFFAL